MSGIVNGILCIDKPKGFTSFKVVAKLRWLLGTRKIGHGGTLDPMATGVLPIFTGASTKAMDLLPNHEKRYTATFRLGITTDTLDITGEVLEQRPVEVSRSQVADVLREFEGKISQLPPMYSAVWVDGVRLYHLARQGIEVERVPREVEIYHIRLLDEDADYTYTVDVLCSRGTYIRSLCHDIGQSLGCGAVLTDLRRTQSGVFTLDNCVTLDEAAELGDRLKERLVPVGRLFEHLPRVLLDGRQTRLLSNGVRLSLGEFPAAIAQAELTSAYKQDGEFLGLVRPYREDGELRVEKFFI